MVNQQAQKFALLLLSLLVINCSSIDSAEPINSKQKTLAMSNSINKTKGTNTAPKLAETVHSVLQKVSIVDSYNNKNMELTSDTLLNRFNYIWSQKQPLLVNQGHSNQRHSNQQKDAYQWRYQITITQNSKMSKWVYDINGYARKISMGGQSTIFKLSSGRSLNQLLNQLAE